MSSNVVMIHGYGFCFQENAVGIIPSKFYGFLEQHPHVKKKVMDKGSDFFEAVCKNRASKEMIAYEDCELKDYHLLDYQWDDTSCCGMAALFVDIVNELKEIGLEVQWDDENGNVVMLPTAAPWEYSKKQKEITSSDHLSQILAECSMESDSGEDSVYLFRDETFARKTIVEEMNEVRDKMTKDGYTPATQETLDHYEVYDGEGNIYFEWNIYKAGYPEN